jgi:hypothetical protein
MTAGQHVHPQPQIWLHDGIGTVVGVAATILMTVAIVAALYFGGHGATLTGAPAPNAAPAVDTQHGTLPAVDPQTSFPHRAMHE